MSLLQVMVLAMVKVSMSEVHDGNLVEHHDSLIV